MNAKILETFESIQGEGPYAGVSQVFVRFFECNMHCVWCDTPHSIGDTSQRYDEYSLEQLNSNVDDLWNSSHSISITGGEPLLQPDFVSKFAKHQRGLGRKIYLETNGTLPAALSKVIDDVDIVAMDIKLPSSTQCKEYWKEHEEFIKIAQSKEIFVKTVISSNVLEDDVVRAMELVRDVDPDLLFILQPNSFDMQNGVVSKCQSLLTLAQEQLNNVRILPQMHRFMKLR